jgi:hypothetical protein
VYEELIPALVTATRIACLRLDTAPGPAAEAAAGPGAETEVFTWLAACAPDPGVARVLMLGPRIVGGLAATAGPAADGIIRNSSRRLLEHLGAGDADAAEHEMERLLRCLHFMGRLAHGSRRTG